MVFLREYIIYSNDLITNVSQYTACCFADDTSHIVKENFVQQAKELMNVTLQQS